MKIIPIADAPARAAEITQVLTDGGLACFPVNGTYRLAADASSDAAIMRLAQSKRRMRNHPALVLVSDLGATRSIVDGASWAITHMSRRVRCCAAACRLARAPISARAR
jgi:tRNA A37 threonylcarbamoyladenosine synthetase subunit TsaC/SUA5/YrdC